MSHISVKNVTKIFGKHPQAMLKKVNAGMDKEALLREHNHGIGVYDINLDIEPGEIFVIMGLSGSGKSTLIRHFNRLIEPTAGQIFVNGQDITTLNQSELRAFRRNTMSMVFQHFGLMPHRRVIDNVAYGLTIQGLTKKEAREKAQVWLERVGLGDYGKSYPQALSGGQQQRVGLARALAADTDIMLMDEAFSALDPLIRAQMQDHLLDLQEQLHKTIIFITHDLSEAIKLGNRIAILNDGRLAQLGTAQEILLNPADDYVREFVRDVNKVEALNISAIMTPTTLILRSETPEQAMEKMRDSGQNYAWLTDDSGYVGMITLDSLLAANADYTTTDEKPNLLTKIISATTSHQLSNKTLNELIRKQPAVTSHRRVETLLGQSVGNAYPLPVVDENNQLIGEVLPEKVAELLRKPSQ